MQVNKEITAKFDLTPTEIARMVAEMDNFEQAEFLNELSDCMEGWTGHDKLMQFQSISDTESLSVGAREMIAVLSDYLKMPESIK